MKTPKIVGDWRIVSPLGSGLSGLVYKVVRKDDPTRVAVLKLFAAKTSRRRFLYEIEMTRRQMITNLMPKFIESGVDHGKPYFVMSFSNDIPERRSRADAVRIFLGIVGDCIALREAGYWHGDLKLENIGLEDGRIILRDFGTVRSRKTANFHPAVTGTPFHRAPENDYRGTVDERTEIFSLGVLFFLLLPPVARLTYAMTILRAVIPIPYLRFENFEDLRKHVKRAPKNRRRRISLAAGLWKTKIVAKYLFLVIILGLLLYGAMYVIVFLYRVITLTVTRYQTQVSTFVQGSLPVVGGAFVPLW